MNLANKAKLLKFSQVKEELQLDIEDKLILAFLRSDENADKKELINNYLSQNINWDKVSDTIIKNGLGGIVYKYLKKNKLNHIIPFKHYQTFQMFYYKTFAVNTKLLQELKLITNNFYDCNIKCYLLKGISHLSTIYNHDIGLRSMSDIDIIVCKDDIEKAKIILEESNYTMNKSLNEFIIPHHLPVYSKNQINLELHFDLFPIPNYFELKLDEFLKSSIFLLDMNAYTFDKEHQLIYLILHLNIHLPELRLNWISDIIGFISKFRINWYRFQKLAKQYGTDKFIFPTINYISRFTNIETIELEYTSVNELNKTIICALKDNTEELGRLSKKYLKQIHYKQVKIAYFKYIITRIFPPKNFIVAYYSLDNNKLRMEGLLIKYVNWIYNIVLFIINRMIVKMTIQIKKRIISLHLHFKNIKR